MISKPTNQQLIEAVCAELTGKVAPNLTDDGTKVVLEMAFAVLLRRGADSEASWRG